MLKRDWVRKATGSYRTYSIPGKTTVLVLEFAVEDMPSAVTAAQVPALAVKDCPWAEQFDEDKKNPPWVWSLEISQYTMMDFIS